FTCRRPGRPIPPACARLMCLRRLALQPSRRLAMEMIERALAAHVPFAWVAADSVYGVGDIEAVLRLSAGQGTKGERLYDWAYSELADLDVSEYDEHRTS